MRLCTYGPGTELAANRVLEFFQDRLGKVPNGWRVLQYALLPHATVLFVQGKRHVLLGVLVAEHGPRNDPPGTSTRGLKSADQARSVAPNLAAASATAASRAAVASSRVSVRSMARNLSAKASDRSPDPNRAGSL
ncbi:MAG: hypothetical protein JWN47_2830 [Frankiales bacterium]|nr:hypothetical protein [Frankiales bacterium]